MSNQQKLHLALSTHNGTASAALREQVQQLADRARAHDANPPLSDQTFIDLAQAGPEQLIAVYAHSADELGTERLLGTAIALRGTDTDPWTVELVVDPRYRQRQVATRILEQLENTLGDLSAVQSWAHGDHPGARVLAERHGLARQRDLYKMRRDSTDLLPAGQLPEHLQLRTFVPGQDEQAWLQANAAAFADHPEQGSMGLADLQARFGEPWFDAAGFFLVVDSTQQIQGFHWTKLVEPDTAGAPRIGEVYVVGVVPSGQGLGLGRILTAAGINHLLGRGVAAVMLYVDAGNTAAVGLYKSLGFTVWDVDVMYGPAR